MLYEARVVQIIEIPSCCKRILNIGVDFHAILMLIDFHQRELVIRV